MVCFLNGMKEKNKIAYFFHFLLSPLFGGLLGNWQAIIFGIYCSDLLACGLFIFNSCGKGELIWKLSIEA